MVENAPSPIDPLIITSWWSFFFSSPFPCAYTLQAILGKFKKNIISLKNWEKSFLNHFFHEFMKYLFDILFFSEVKLL